MRKGFTLIEILVTIVVLAVLAAIAFPNFSKAQGKNDARQAITYLRAIRLAEKIYYAKNGVYLVCADDTAIKSNLGAEIANGKYVFSVAATATTFTAMATASAYGTTITLDETGVFKKNGVAYSPS
jgi:type IV pilus assembly protein PilE